MINSLRLHNFRKHQDLYLEFPPGLTVLCGANWAGKTSVMSAIPFALFGTRATPGSAADLPTFGTTDMRVELEFSVLADTYKVTRTLKSASLAQGERTLATGHAAVTAEVERIIGTTMRDFLDFNVTAQGEADGLLLASSAKMSDYVARATGTDVVDRALERIKEEQQGCKGALSALPEGGVSLEELTDRLQGVRISLFEANKEHAAAEAAAIAASAAHLDAEEAAEETKAKAEASSESRRKRQLAEDNLANARQRLKIAFETLSTCSEEASDLVTVKEKVASLSAAVAQQAAQTAERTELVKLLGQAEADIAVLLAAKAGKALIATQPLTDAKQEALLHLLACQQAGDNAKKAVDNAACPYCKRPFEDADLGALYATRDEAEARIEPAQAALAETEARLQEASKSNVYLQELESSLAAWTSYRDTGVAKLAELDQALANPVDAAELEPLQAELRVLEEAAAKRQMAEYDVGSASHWVTQAEARLAAYPKTPEGLTSADVAVAQDIARRASESLLKAYHRLDMALRAVEAARGLLVPLEAAVEAESARQEQRKHFQVRAAKLHELGKFLRDNRDRFTSEFWTNLLGYASTLIQEATSGAVTRLSRNAAGDFVYEENGREIAVDGSASGMQRAIFGTAIKLSLAAGIGNPFPVMLFDEVTAAAQDEVSLQFTALLASAGKQVIMVTHRSADAAAADNLLVI